MDPKPPSCHYPDDTSDARPGQLEVVIRIGLDPDGRPVGWASTGSGSGVSFEGWLALMAELSRLLEARVGD
jgi:hypothetical protein